MSPGSQGTVWSWHWDVTVDVGPFAGAELRVTALAFTACLSSPPPLGIINSLVAMLQPFSAVSANVVSMQNRNLKEE